MASSKIEWTDETWNPIRGCSKVSPGCTHCYAERMAARFSGPGQPYEGLTQNGRWTGEVRLAPHRKLTEPLRWRKPRRVFVNSMSDLFHESLSDQDIDRVYAIMAICANHARFRGHVFQVLTKRSKRMRAYLTNPFLYQRIACAAGQIMEDGDRWLYFFRCWPRSIWHPSIWIGVTVEDQERAYERIPHLLDAPAAVRFVSCEPLLEEVSLAHWMRHLDWVISGCESGPGRRSASMWWFHTLKEQCVQHGVPYFCKQAEVDGLLTKMPRIDGCEWAEYPDKIWELGQSEAPAEDR